MHDPWVMGFPEEGTPVKAMPRVYTPRWNLPIVAYLLSNSLATRYLHFDSEIGRRVPCSRSEDCAYCPDPTREPTGYLPAFCPKQKKPCVLQLSKSALATLREIVASRPELRGLKVKTERADRRPCARMILTVIGETDPAYLPADFDVRPSLESMWGWSLRGVLLATVHQDDDDDDGKPKRKRG